MGRVKPDRPFCPCAGSRRRAIGRYYRLALEAGRLDDVFRDLTRGLESRATMMRQVGLVTRREFNSYFATPLAFVFIFVFLLATGLSTFYLGGYFEAG